GYTILSLTQLCSAAEAAKAKRKAYKSERKKQADKRNAFHARNNKDQMERVTKLKDIRIEALRERVREADTSIQEFEDMVEEMRREDAAELESRDAMQAILLVDLRELTQVYDEEVEVLKRTIDRQALPPDYSSINNLGPVIALEDTGSATPEHVIATALSTLRKALAAPSDSDSTPKHLVHIANTLHTSLLASKKGFTTHLWPLSATSASLHATHECVDRVIHFLAVHHPDLDERISSPLSSPFLRHLTRTFKSPSTLLRRAFSCADSLALELCSLHFASGGRRAGLMLPVRPLSLDAGMLDSGDNEIDTNDDLLELQYWKKKLESVRREALERMEDVGITVFGDTIAWLEQEIMSLV
ncbi:hypothetical protein M436DRAFT_46112, partial [Aureobasidium namibiae CBS 147.97]